jgi:hypothetical protein
MQLLKQMAPSAVLAAAVAAMLLFVFARWKKIASRCAGAIAISTGYVAGHVLGRAGRLSLRVMRHTGCFGSQ